MATDFSVQFILKMQTIGYKLRDIEYEPTLAHYWFQDMSGAHNFNFQVVYVKQALTLPRIKDLFDRAYMMPVLFIVDSNLITDMTIEESWLKALHALYYGRVYAWDGAGVVAIHHNKHDDRLERNGHIEFKKIEFREVDSWYPKFPGKFQIATFGDRAFWTPEASKKQKPPKDNAQNEYEAFWRQQYAQQPHNNPNYSQKQSDYKADQQTYEEFRRAYEREQARHGNYYESPQQPKRAPKGDDWYELMMKPGDKEGAKKVYRQLARENHPDSNKSPNATQIMQAINEAYEQVMEYFE